MLAKTDVTKIYETLLSSPGMEEMVKLNLKIPRKNILLLSKLIERGISGRENDEKSIGILELVSKETTQELLGISKEILEKAGLSQMNEKLKAF